MKTDHSIFEMKKKISPSNGFEEYYDRKLPNKANDELVETLKKVKNKPMPKSRKKILFTNAFEKSLEQQQKLEYSVPSAQSEFKMVISRKKISYISYLCNFTNFSTFFRKY